MNTVFNMGWQSTVPNKSDQCKPKGRHTGKTRLKPQAIKALLTHSTISGAAESIGIADRTLRVWLQDPAFKAMLKAAENEIFQHSMTRLKATTAKAIDKLETIVDSPASTNTEIYSASKTLLEYGFKAGVVEDMSARLDRLEQQDKEDDE